MLENRVIQAIIGIVGILGLIYFGLWGILPNIAVIVLGVISIVLIIVWQLKYAPKGKRMEIKSTFLPKLFNKDTLKIVVRNIKYGIVSLIVAMMLYAMFTDSVLPTIPAIAWRAIASMWFAMAVLLLLERAYKRRTEDNAMSKFKPQRLLVEKEFEKLVDKASTPISEWNKPDSEETETSAVHPSDDCNGKCKSQDTTEGKED